MFYFAIVPIDSRIAKYKAQATLKDYHPLYRALMNYKGKTWGFFDDGDVWMLGGGKLQMAFIERGALDEIEVYVMSALLGGGYPLFPPTGFFKENIELLEVNKLGAGCARLLYRFN